MFLKIITRKETIKTEELKTKKIFLNKLPFNIFIKLTGKFYWHGLIPTNSKALAGFHHVKKFQLEG